MKHIFIINPAAGKTDSRQRVYQMADALKKNHGLDVECMLTKSSGHATALTRGIASSGGGVRFYACGGDGTVNEVANGIAGLENAAMTVVPIGTGNDFLKNFGDDAAKFADPENLWNGRTQKLDLIDCNGRQCLTIACSGIDARIARDVHRYSTTPLLDGKGSYVASLIVNFLFKGIGSHWTVELDGTEQEPHDFSLVAVCNGRYYGGGFMPVPNASMTDGVLNTLVVKKVSRLTFAQFVGPYSKGEYEKCAKFVSYSTARSIRIHSEKPDIVTCLDGEILVSGDVTLRLSDKKLNFFGPAGCSPDATLRRKD
ncbi:MAG: BmrU protein [Ruminococcaceae bacterium]|nr:BmrU protein [Oscillospiraceae bacterium]